MLNLYIHVKIYISKIEELSNFLFNSVNNVSTCVYDTRIKNKKKTLKGGRKKTPHHVIKESMNKTTNKQLMVHFDDLLLRAIASLEEFSDSNKELNLKLGFDPYKA